MNVDFGDNSVLQNSVLFDPISKAQRAPYYCNVSFSNMRMGVDVTFALGRLGEIGRLPADWDGYGAASVDEDIINTARRWVGLLSHRVPLPEILPNSNGTVSLEWETANGSAHVELGLEEFSFYLAPSAGLSYHISGMLSEADPGVVFDLVVNHLYPSFAYTKPTNSIVQRGLNVAMF